MNLRRQQTKLKFPVNLSNRTQREIKNIVKKLWYTRMQLQKATLFDRKADSRKKIMLGGLFVKAGLDYLHPENAYILYGMLLDCKQQLILNPKIINNWKEKGKSLLLPKKQE